MYARMLKHKQHIASCKATVISRSLAVVFLTLFIAIIPIIFMPCVNVYADNSDDMSTVLGTTGADDYQYISGGDPAHPSYNSNAAKTVGLFNIHLLTYTTVAGVIVVALGVVKLIISLSDHAPMAKVSATTTISLGIVLITASQAVNIIQQASDPTADDATRVKNILGILSNGLLWPGVVLAVIGMFKNIFAIMHERPEEKMEAGKMIGIAAALMSASFIMDGIVDYTIGSKKPTNANVTGGYVSYFIIFDVIVPVAIIAGVLILAAGMFAFAQSFRDENPEGKARSTIIVITGLLLTMGGAIVKMIFGLA